MPAAGTDRGEEDEFAIVVKLDVEKDIGLLVYDYQINEHQFGGGVSHADRSMIRRDEQLIITFSREELNNELETDTDKYLIKMRFRIITEYVDPNFENIYPQDITRYLEPLEWEAYLGQQYNIRITGDKTGGYMITLEQ